MSLHIALCDQDADDTYPAEHWAARKLDAWRALKRGFWDGGNVGGQADLTDEAWTAMEMRRDDTRAYGARADAERTDQAVALLKAADALGWRALECFHFVSTNLRDVRRACKCRADEVPSLLNRAHESLYLHYAQIANKPAPSVALRPVAARIAAPVLDLT